MHREEYGKMEFLRRLCNLQDRGAKAENESDTEDSDELAADEPDMQDPPVMQDQPPSQMKPCAPTLAELIARHQPSRQRMTSSSSTSHIFIKNEYGQKNKN